MSGKGNLSVRVVFACSGFDLCARNPLRTQPRGLVLMFQAAAMTSRRRIERRRHEGFVNLSGAAAVQPVFFQEALVIFQRRQITRLYREVGVNGRLLVVAVLVVSIRPCM